MKSFNLGFDRLCGLFLRGQKISLSACVLGCLGVAQAASVYTTRVEENELVSGTATSRGIQESLAGNDISVSDGDFSSRAWVDSGVSGSVPTLRVRSTGSSDSSFNDPDRSRQAFAIAQTSTLFKATSGTQPFETAFNAGVTIDIDGSIFFDVANAATTEFSPFRPGDSGVVSFSMSIRPESDEYYTAANSISFGSEIVWDHSGITIGDLNVYDGDFNPIGMATVTQSDTGLNTKSFSIAANIPFTAQVGVDYSMESYFQSSTILRGGVGSKSIDMDFFNSMNTAPEAQGGDFDFVLVPEPASAILVLFGATLGLRRRR